LTIELNIFQKAKIRKKLNVSEDLKGSINIFLTQNKNKIYGNCQIEYLSKSILILRSLYGHVFPICQKIACFSIIYEINY